MPGQCFRMPSWTAPNRSGLEDGVSSSLRTWMCTSDAPASNASCFDSICSAVEIGTAGLSFLRGTEPVMATAMTTGFMAKSLQNVGRRRTASRGAPSRPRSGSRHCRMRRQPRLGSEPDRRVDGAEAGIVPPLDDLEEEAVVERARVDLEVLGRAVAVVEDLAFSEARDRLRGEVGAGLEVVVVVFRDRQEIDAAFAQPADGREDVVGRERDVLDAGAEQFVEEARRKRALALRGVEDEAQGAVLARDHLALHDAAGVEHVVDPRLTEVEKRGVEQKPGQHLLVVHRLRDVVEADEARLPGAWCGCDGIEVDVPDAGRSACPIDEVDEAAAEAAHRRNLELARPDPLAERLVDQLHGALDRRRGVGDPQRDRADRRAMGDVEGMGEAFLLAVDDDVDVALAPAGDVLRLVLARLGEAEPGEQRLEIRGGGLVHRELDELDAGARRARRQRRQARNGGAGPAPQLVEHEDQRALPVDRDAAR